MSTVAVLDIGKTNVKLTVATRDGRDPRDGVGGQQPGSRTALHSPGHRRRSKAGSSTSSACWRDGTASDAVVATCHGSANALVDDQGPLMPMIDYEQEPPDGGQSRPTGARSGRSPPMAARSCRAATTAPASSSGWRRSGPRPSPAPATFSVARNTGPGDSPGSPRPSSPISARSRISGTCAHGASRRSCRARLAAAPAANTAGMEEPRAAQAGARPPPRRARRDRGALRHSRFEREFLSLPAGRLREARADLDRHVPRRPRGHRRGRRNSW